MMTPNWAITSTTILSQTTTRTRSRVLHQSLNWSSRGTTFSRKRLRTSRTECRRTASPAIVSYLWAARVKRRPRAVILPLANWRRSETKRARNWTLSSEYSSPRRSGSLAGVSHSARIHVQMSATWLSFPLLMLFPGWCPISEGGVTSHKRFVLGLVKSTGPACCFLLHVQICNIVTAGFHLSFLFLHCNEHLHAFWNSIVPVVLQLFFVIAHNTIHLFFFSLS